jgi:hypothetical protein
MARKLISVARHKYGICSRADSTALCLNASRTTGLAKESLGSARARLGCQIDLLAAVREARGSQADDGFEIRLTGFLHHQPWNLHIQLAPLIDEYGVVADSLRQLERCVHALDGEIRIVSRRYGDAVGFGTLGLGPSGPQRGGAGGKRQEHEGEGNGRGRAGRAPAIHAG